MAVESPDSVLTFAGNNSTVTAYPVDFRFLLRTDVKVSLLAPGALQPTLLTEETDYTLHIEHDSNNVITDVYVTTIEPYDNQHTLFIYREVPLTQLTELPEFGPFPANTLEMSLDKMVMALQQLDRAQRRSFRTSSFGPELTPPYPQPNTVLGISGTNDLRLYTGPELLAFLQLPGSLVDAPTVYWIDDADRAIREPDFVGQLGLQMDDSSLWRSTGLVAGNWTLLALDEDTMTSNSHRRPPTQQSVKVYVDAAKAEANIYANDAAAAAQAAAISAANAYTDAGAPSLTIARFTARDNQAPTANWARLSTRNGISTIRFSDTTFESACFIGILPEGINLSNGVHVRLLWAAGAVTGSSRWGAFLNRLNGDIDAISELQVGAVTTATPATSGVLAVSTVTYVSNPGLLAGEAFQLRIVRDPAHADDNMASDAEIVAVELRRRVP